MSECEWCNRPAVEGDVCCRRCDEENGKHSSECDARRNAGNRSSGEVTGYIKPEGHRGWWIGAERQSG